MVSAIERMDTLYHLAKSEVALFSRRSGLGYAAMAKRSGIAPVSLRGLVDPDTWSPTLKTLNRVYEAFHDHDDWPGRDAGLWRETSGDDGSMLRRVYRDYERPFFADIIATWKSVKGTGSGPEVFDRFDTVSIIEAGAEAPDDFIVVTHARQSKGWTPVDFEGRRIADLKRPAFYLDAYILDLLDVKVRREPVLSEVVWSNTTIPNAGFFWRLILPFGCFLVSCVHVAQAGLPAERSIRMVRSSAVGQ